MKSLIQIIAAVLLFTALFSYSAQVQAELISVDYAVEGDALLVRDTETNLEWLNLTLTNNRSFIDVNSELNHGGEFEGFRHASPIEVAEFFRNAGIPDVPGQTPENFEPVHALITLIYMPPPPIEDFVPWDNKGYLRIIGVTNEIPWAGEDYHTGAQLTVQSGSPDFPDNLGFALPNESAIRPSISHPEFSHYLVRDVQGPLPEPMPVTVDIKPRKCPNKLNVKKLHYMGVAILGTENFDVAAIDRASIRLEGVPPIRSRIRDKSRPIGDSQDECDCTEEGADGFDDLWLKFCAQEIVNEIGDVNHREQVLLTLEGELTDGTPIEGTDCLVIIDRH